MWRLRPSKTIGKQGGERYAPYHGNLSSHDRKDQVLSDEALHFLVLGVNGNGGIAYPATLSVTAGDSITLPTPVQPKTYTISYNANGGQVAISSNTVDCSFSTWNTKADGSGTNYRTDASYAPEGFDYCLEEIWLGREDWGWEEP